MLKYFLTLLNSMGGRRKKRSLELNQRLDFFLQKLEIKQDKREQIVKYVEDLAFETTKKKSGVQQLRLKI